MPVTRDDVARAAGVSSAVVSYVINNGPRPVAKETRARVLQAIDDLGWKPDRNARNLRRGRSDLLGLVAPDLSLPFVSQLTDALTREAERVDMRLMVASSGWSLEGERAQIGHMIDARVAGLLLMSVNPGQALDVLETSDTAVTVIDRPKLGTLGTACCVTHLAEHGRSRIGFVGGPKGHFGSDRRFRAWKQTLKTLGFPAAADQVIRVPAESAAVGRAAARRWAQGEFMVDGLFFDYDLAALGFLRGAHEEGINLPEDVSLVTFEGSYLGGLSIPTLTTLQQPADRIAAAAIAAVTTTQGGSVKLVTDELIELIIRESCGCQTGAPHPQLDRTTSSLASDR